MKRDPARLTQVKAPADTIGQTGTMARFFFHVVNDTSSMLDHEGSDLPGLKAACAHARKVIGGIIKDELPRAHGVIHLTVMIDDADQVRVANIKTVTTIAETTNPFAD